MVAILWAHPFAESPNKLRLGSSADGGAGRNPGPASCGNRRPSFPPRPSRIPVGADHWRAPGPGFAPWPLRPASLQKSQRPTVDLMSRQIQTLRPNEPSPLRSFKNQSESSKRSTFSQRRSSAAARVLRSTSGSSVSRSMAMIRSSCSLRAVRYLRSCCGESSATV